MWHDLQEKKITMKQNKVVVTKDTMKTKKNDGSINITL